MAKKKEDFELDDWDFSDDGLDFGEFDVEPGRIDKKSRNPIMQTGGAVLKGAREAALNPSNMKRFLKDSLPTEYGSTFNTIETGISLGKSLYDDTAREMRPVIQEGKKLGRRILPQIRGIIPEGIAAKLDEALADDSRNYDTSKEAAQEALIAGTLGEIFRAQAEQHDQEREEAFVQQKVQETVDAKRHKASMDVYGNIARGIERLAQYQDKVTVNWQRKTLEIQYRQYFIQQETLEEQKKMAATLQTNLEGILKNTALPDYLKITKLEATKENIRNRFINATLDSLAGKRKGWLGDVSRNLREVVKGRVKEFKEGISSAFEAGTQGLEAVEMQQEIGGDTDGFIAGQVGGNIFERLARYAGRKVRDVSERNSKLVNIGRNLDKYNRNLRQYGTKGANEGWGEDIPILGPIFGMLNEAINKTNSRETTIDTQRNRNVDDPSFFDVRTHRSINDVIPGYLARILQSTTAIGKRMGVTPEDLPSLLVYDHKSNRLISDKRMQAKVTAEFFNKDKMKELSKRGSDIIDRLEEEIHDNDEIKDEDKLYLAKSDKDVLLNHLFKMQLNNEVLDPRVLQDEEFWTKAKFSKEDAAKYSKFFIQSMGKYREGKDVESTRGIWDKSKAIYDNLSKSDGTNYRAVKRFQEDFSLLGDNITSQLANLQRLSNEGHEDALRRAGLLNQNGVFDEEAYLRRQLAQYGYQDTDDVDENQIKSLRSVTGLGVEAMQALDAIEKMPAHERHDSNFKYKRLMDKVKSDKAYKKQYAANGGFIKGYANGGFATGGYANLNNTSTYSNVNSTDYTVSTGGGYTGNGGQGSKWQPAGTVHAGEVVWSQRDIEKWGGVLNVEALRKFGVRALKNITQRGSELSSYLKGIGDTAKDKTEELVDKFDEKIQYFEIAKNVAEIRNLLAKGIPVSGFTNVNQKDAQDVPWYLQSFGDVVGNMAMLPFKVANNLFKGVFKGASSFAKSVNKVVGGVWNGIKALTRKGRSRMISFKDKMADNLDIYVGKITNFTKPRLNAVLLKAGQYYNEDGKQLKSWKDITGRVYHLDPETNTFNLVLDIDEIKDAFAVDYMKGKSFVLSTIAKVRDFGLNQLDRLIGGANSAIKLGVEAVKGTAKLAYRGAKSWVYRPEDVYIKGQEANGPVLLARLMKQGYYVSQRDPNKTIDSPADIDGPVLDREGNIALSVEDMKKGLVDKFGKPLRVGFGKIAGLVGDTVGKSFKAMVSVARGLGRGVSAITGGMKNFFKAFFEDGGLIFANSAKITDRLDKIYNLLDERMPGKKKLLGDTDGDGDRDGSVKDLRERNRLKKLAEAEEKLRKQKELEELKGKKETSLLSKLIDKMKGKGSDEEDEEGDTTIIGGWGEGKDSGRRNKYGRRVGKDKTRLDKMKQKGRIAKKRAGRKVSKLFGRGPGRAAGKAGMLARGGGMLKTGVKGVGAGLLLAGASSMANAAGMEGTANFLDTAGTVATAYTVGSMATQALGYGSLAAVAGKGIAGISAVGGSLMSGLGAAATFLATNPIGWAILATAAVAGIGYMAYRYFKNRKLDPIAEYRYTQYGFDANDKSNVKVMYELEDFVKDLVDDNGATVEINLSKKADLKKFIKIFDLEMDQKEAIQNALKWTTERFKPVYDKYRTALKQLGTKVDLDKVDDKLSKEDKLKFLSMVQFPEGPYEMRVSPVTSLKELPSGTIQVNRKYEEIRKRIEEGKESSGILSKAANLIPGVAAFRAAKELVNKTTGSDNAKPDGTKPTEEVSATSKLLDKAKLLGASIFIPGASVVKNIITANVDSKVGKKDSKINALRATKLKAYGLNTFETDKVVALESLERQVLQYVEIGSDKQAKFTGDIEYIANKTSSSFGISVNDASNYTAFKAYLEMRFIPVVVTLATVISRVQNKFKFDGFDEASLKPQEQMDAAQAIISTNSTVGSIWSVTKGLWSGYRLNTDSGSVDTHLRAIKTNLKSSEMASEEATVKDYTAEATAAADTSAAAMAKSEEEAAKKTELMKETKGNLFSKAASWASALAAGPAGLVAKNVTDRFKQWTGIGEDTSLKATAQSAVQTANDVAQGAIDYVTQTKVSTKTKDLMKSIYNAFRKAGFSHNQSLALTAEVGRENDYNPKYVFGEHGDYANGRINLGFISWQKERRTALQQRLRAKGLMQGNNASPTQESLDEMAAYLKWEMEHHPYEKTRAKSFLANPNGDPEQLANDVGRNFIRWDISGSKIGSDKARKHLSRRNGYLSTIRSLVGNQASNAVATAASTAGATVAGTTANPFNGKGPLMSYGQQATQVDNWARTGGTAGSTAANASTYSMPTTTTNDGWASMAGSAAFTNGRGYAASTKQANLEADGGADSAPSGSVGAGSVPESHRAAKAARTALNRAMAKSAGKCARYVREALQAGGYKFPKGWPVSACNYGQGYIQAAGFVQIPNNSPVQVGDVEVWPAHGQGNKNGGRIHGHIRIWTGNVWCSDFREGPANKIPGKSYAVVRPTRWRDATLMNGVKLPPIPKDEPVRPIPDPMSQATVTNAPQEYMKAVRQESVTNPSQAITGVPGSDQQNDRWAAVRKGNNVETNTTLVDDFKTLLGPDTAPDLSTENRRIQSEINAKQESDRVNSITNVLSESLKEHRLHTQLLTSIETVLKGISQQGGMIVANSATITTEKEVPVTKPSEGAREKLFNESRKGIQTKQMNQGNINLKKTAYN